MSLLKVYIWPNFPHADTGEGGIRRVVEAQRKHLPAYGIEIVESEAEADVVAMHAGSYVHTNKPVVAHNHGLYWSDYAWDNWCHDLNRACIDVLRRCDAATGPSEWVSYAIRRGMNIDVQTVYHGVDAHDWRVGDKSRRYVLWNKSRVDAICDVGPLNACVAALPDVQFASTYGTHAPNLLITGRQPFAHAKLLVESASVYLCTARETFGIGTLEAMASGAVVVGYDWGGQREIITNGHDGLLVPPGNTEALAAAVVTAMADYERLAANALVKVREFTWERAAEQYARLYKQVEREHKERTRTSVVITCYNLAHSLPRAVSSVDDPEAEIIVVDDASPDETAAVAARLAQTDPRIKVLTNTSNLYLSGALNAGIGAATGRYVVPLDADNELAPGALEILAGALDANPDLDVVYGSMLVEQEQPSGHVFKSGWPADFVYERQMAHRNQLPSTSMYRYKWWQRSGGYRRRCRTAEDADFWCRITSLGAQPKKVTEDPTLIYHDRNDSMSHVEADWDWTAWYTWARVPELTPFGAPATQRKRVPSYEPALVTVVIPVGPGHAKYLYDALDSLVAQTFVGWRCVVVDDTGNDELDDVIFGPGLPPWVALATTSAYILDPLHDVKPSDTPATARNVGVLASSTPYVLFLDADDYLAPSALELLLDAAKDRSVDGVSAKEYYYCDWYKQEEGKVYKAPDFVADHLITHLTHSVTALYPTQALRDVGLFDETLDAWEDWDLVLKLIEAGYCGVHVPFPLLYYRYTTGQRREQLYADRTRHTDVMRNKWRKYMVDGESMACGCQGGRTKYVAPVVVNNTPLPVTSEGRTLVEFTGTSAPRTYRGHSGKEYRFGSDAGHKLHYVENQDLPIFTSRPGFQIARSNTEGFAILQALGPPDRVRELELVANVPY